MSLGILSQSVPSRLTLGNPKAQGVWEASDLRKARISQGACCTGAHVLHALCVEPARLIVDKKDCHRSRSRFFHPVAQRCVWPPTNVQMHFDVSLLPVLSHQRQGGPFYTLQRFSLSALVKTAESRSLLRYGVVNIAVVIILPDVR